MSEKRTVYSVSSGAYSNYRVEALFEDHADANANAVRHPDWYVEEFDLHPPGSSDALVPWHGFTAWAWVNSEGHVSDEVAVVEWHDYPDEGPPQPSTSLRSTRQWPIGLSDGSQSFEWHVAYDVYEVGVTANDEERARKAVRERAAEVAAVIAEGGDPKIAY